MKRWIALGAAVALLGTLALSSTALAQEPLSVTLDSLEGFTITGTATLTPSADGSQTDVVMIGSGLDPGGGTHINHIHDGAGCGQGEYAGVVVTLTPLADTDGDGMMLGVTMVTQTDGGDPISFAEIADGNHVLIIHELDGAPAACGVIPAMVAQETDLAAIFGQYADAVNQGDVDAALALFTEDATWVRGGRCPPGACVGQAAIRVELEVEVASDHRIDIIDTQVTGSTLTARAEFQTDRTREAGVERIILAYTVEFQGDKISLLRAMPDLTDPQTAAFVGSMMPMTGAPETGTGPDSASGGRDAAPIVLALLATIAGGALLAGGRTLRGRASR